MTYLHRNGETEPPTIYEEYYWFQALEGSRWEATWGCYYVMPPYGEEGAFLSDCHPLAELEGHWWGPVQPPWDEETESPPDLGVHVIDATQVADRMG